MLTNLFLQNYKTLAISAPDSLPNCNRVLVTFWDQDMRSGRCLPGVVSFKFNYHGVDNTALH